MFIQLIQNAIKFVAENAIVLGMIFAFTAWVKSFQPQLPWMKEWYLTIVAFVLGFLLIIPVGTFAPDLQFLANGIAIGLTATGAYKGASYIAVKGQQGKQA